MAKLLSVLAKILWVLLFLFIMVYVLNFIFVGEALAKWGMYTWIAHAIVIGAWSALAFGIGRLAVRIRS
ncbi:hypothetical protein [Alloalcanivorax marinus]|uniref:hypothetical protein n=1 Tax=Alloalcanivorax marinus TaxID=1177169 RepID=UPI0019348B1D|nr:hypothetical protein [Alloalcanivorax marinus]MBL7252585.1 hypothetical protein [Alloalcanivorax marinus]